MAKAATVLERKVERIQNAHKYTTTENGLVDEQGTRYVMYESHGY